MKGKLLIFSAPSGAGKTTIVRSLLQTVPDLEFSVSACSRKPRPGEADGKDYYFLGAGDFKKRISAGDFLEWQEVYPDFFYGTLKSEVARIWNNGHHAVFDVDVLGGLNIKKIYPEESLAVFIRPPSIQVLYERLVHRGTDTPETIRKRIDKASYEMSFANRFDRIIVNLDITKAVVEARTLVEEFIRS